MTIDLEEIYLAYLMRGCKLEVVSQEEEDDEIKYYIKITETNGVNYLVMVSSDHTLGYDGFFRT